MATNKWQIKIDKFYQGYSPAAHLNTSTSIGNAGHATEMVSVDILTPDYITQGPELVALTLGTQAGAITELVHYILDTPPIADTTYGIGNTKLQRISSTAVTNAGGVFPHTITNGAAGKSIAYLKGVVYYFFNTSSDSQIGTYNLDTTFDDDWQTGLVKATLIPVATKEDILLFGHGRYVGTYFSSTNTINKTKLDFGTNYEVADICFHANQWIIAVNGGITGTNRNTSNIYTYAGGATTAILSDEASVGLQKVGFLYPLNGVIYVAYQDLTFDGGYTLGYLSGRKIEPLVRFKGGLPTYAQKTLYKNTILFLAGGLVYSAGAVIGELPFALSQLADGGLATCGALAAPFGTPMIASTDGASAFQLAKFSGMTVTSSWKSTIIPIGSGRTFGHLTDVVVRTNSLGANARCDLIIYANQSASTLSTLSITGTAKTRHVFKLPKTNLEDVKIYLNWANGNATNDCRIKDITLIGNYITR